MPTVIRIKKHFDKSDIDKITQKLASHIKDELMSMPIKLRGFQEYDVEINVKIIRGVPPEPVRVK